MVEQFYFRAKSTPSDINEHLEILSRLSSLCDDVVEFGVRDGISSLALLHGRPKRLRSYDIGPCGAVPAISAAAAEAQVDYAFFQQDCLTVDLGTTDLLFIDTLHTFEQLQSELARHAASVRRYIAMHDTSTFGDRDEVPRSNAPAYPAGLWPAIRDFLRKDRDWRLQFYNTNNNGLTVLERAASHV